MMLNVSPSSTLTRARFRRMLAASVAAVSLTLPAAAVPLPPPVVSGTAQFNREASGQTIGTFGLLDHSVSPFGTLQFFSAGMSAPSLRAAADIGPIVNFATTSGTSSGFLRYSFEIVGPDRSVPIFAAASGHVAGVAGDGGGFEAIARWSLRNTSEIRLLEDSVSVFFNGVGAGATNNDSYVRNHATTLQANQEYRVVMEVLVRASTGINAVGFGNAGAFVDPVFSFGAGVGPEYSFVFSEGIGNTPPIPEPHLYALLAAGLLTLGYFRRRAGTRRQEEAS